MLAAANLNADDTPVKVLAPGKGKTKRGRLWTYVRDGRPWKSRDPAAVWYRYSPSWRGMYPQKHLAGYRGKLQVDAYAGFDPLFASTTPGEPARILEIACAAHMRRKFFNLHAAAGSALAKEALDRFGELYRIEQEIRGHSPQERLSARQQYAVPKLCAFRSWMLEKLSQVENKSEIADALRYSLKNWEALVRYTEDGQLEIDNNAAERSIRGIGSDGEITSSSARMRVASARRSSMRSLRPVSSTASIRSAILNTCSSASPSIRSTGSRSSYPGTSPTNSTRRPGKQQPEFMSKPARTAAFENIQRFLDGSRGQITIGEIPPIRRAALAAEGKKVRVALVCRESESATALLERLDAELGKAMAAGAVLDEVLPEIKRRRTR